MKPFIITLVFLFFLAIQANAADEKIDPATYICAELVAASLDGQPPVFEGLQIDGFYSAQKGISRADPALLAPLLIEVSDSCASQPTDKVLSHWEKARKKHLAESPNVMDVNKYKCSDYIANPDDGSGFVIWADAYNRAKKGKSASVLSSQEAIDNFLQVCKNNQDKLMIDIIDQTAR